MRPMVDAFFFITFGISLWFVLLVPMVYAVNERGIGKIEIIAASVWTVLTGMFAGLIAYFLVWG